MIQDFITYLTHEKRYSHNTIESYRKDILAFLDSCPNHDRENALEWLKSIKTTHKPNSIKRKVSAVNSYYKFCNVPSPLSNIKIRQGNRVPVFCGESDMDRILDDYNYPDNFIGHRNKLVIYLIYFSGIRATEITFINTQDVNNGFIKINGKGNKQRLVPIPIPLMGALNEYLNVRKLLNCKSNILILTQEGKPTTRVLIGKIVKNTLSFSTKLEKCSPHVLRHTFATAMINNGANIMALKELLGHESVKTTQIYTHTNINGLKKAYKSLPRQ